MGAGLLAGAAVSAVSSYMSARKQQQAANTAAAGDAFKSGLEGDPDETFVRQKQSQMMDKSYLGTNSATTDTNGKPWEGGVGDYFGNRMAKRFSGISRQAKKFGFGQDNDPGNEGMGTFV